MSQVKTYKLIIVAIAAVIFLEFAVPALTRWNGLILPVISKNCGAVPKFLQQIMTVKQAPTNLAWRRTITCGIGGILFLLVPGFLRFGSWTYRFLKS